MTTEAINTITAGATPVQIITLICVGGIFLWGIFSFVRWLIKIKTAHLDSLPQDIKEIKEKLNSNALELNSMSNKLWSEEKVKSEFEAAIEHHQNMCPAWRRYCSMSKDN